MIDFLKRMFGMEKILFADLDGTIIETKSGETFPRDNDDWKLKGGIVRSLQKYRPTHLFIVSNQGGIEKGFVDEFDFCAKMEAVIGELKGFFPRMKIETLYCPSNNISDHWRKPNVGMAEYLLEKYHFKKENALMIGDASGLKGQFSDSDFQCATNFGIKYLDVSFFIQYGNPCFFCHNDDCEMCGGNINYDVCDATYSITFWIEEFLKVYGNKQG